MDRLNEVVREASTALSELLAKNISIVLSLSAEPLFIRVEPGQLDQVIMSLALNALDAMPEGGKLYLETSRLLVEDDFAAACLSVPSGVYVTLAVTDTGSGMPPEVRARIFEPSFTTKKKGARLELSTVYGIVRQAGGNITVHSSPGVGSTFLVLFPALDELPKAERNEALAGGTETLLLVDDDHRIRKYILNILKAHGYTVLDAANGRDAIELARRYRSAIDLLLVDTVLPDLGGVEIASEIESIRPGIKVMRMSGYAETPAPSPNFMQKPFAPEELLKTVRAALDVIVSRRNLP